MLRTRGKSSGPGNNKSGNEMNNTVSNDVVTVMNSSSQPDLLDDIVNKTVILNKMLYTNPFF